MKSTFIFITGLFFVGCSQTTVVLLESGKKQNAIIVSTNKGSSKIDKAGSYVNLKDKESAVSKVKVMSKEELESRFSKVLAASPKEPAKYILCFKPKSKELTEESQKILPEVIKTIEEYSPCMVDIIGHTDTTGSSELNIKVSLKRAKVIESILKEKGVKVVSMTAKGYGEEDLQVQTADNIAEAKNRNVEIFIK